MRIVIYIFCTGSRILLFELLASIDVVAALYLIKEARMG